MKRKTKQNKNESNLIKEQNKTSKSRANLSYHLSLFVIYFNWYVSLSTKKKAE